MGTIASLEEELVKGGNGRELRAYLVEARSIGGLSGSPVYVLPSLETRLRSGKAPFERRPSLLFGLVHGHFDLKNLNDDAVQDEISGTTGINSGICIVVPARKILETINQPTAMRDRQAMAEDAQRRQDRAEAGATTPGQI